MPKDVIVVHRNGNYIVSRGQIFRPVETEMTNSGYTTLREQAQALRREELARIAALAAVKWQTLLQSRVRHASLPRQSPSPTHP